MNLKKAELKIALAKDFGRQFEEKKREAVNEQWANIGEVRALKKAGKAVADLMGGVDRDLKEGKVDALLNEPLLIAKYGKRQYQHAIGVIDNLATQAEIACHRSAGLEVGFRRSADMLRKVHDDELARLENLRAAIDKGSVKLVDGELVMQDGVASTGGPPPPGGHPGLSLKDQRLMEEAEEKPVEKTGAPTGPVTVTEKPKGRKKSAVEKEKSKMTILSVVPPDATRGRNVKDSDSSVSPKSTDS